MREAILAPKAPLIKGGAAILRIKDPAGLIRLAGAFVILLAGGAALLPFLTPASGTTTVGALLLVAGLVETLAGRLRRETRLLAVLAGVATTVAGVLLLVAPVGGLLHSASIVTFWLLIRSLILAINSRRAHGSVRMWLGISAGADLVLGVGLLTGLSITALLLTLFGETPQLVASFSWVLAFSFVATGTMLLEVAGCERNAS
jgi:uncharacterized membrane protein HdeD (DUF308 family)